MRNPFEFGGLVNEGSFCNRSQELRDVLSHMTNGTNLFLYGERRTGKTSLARIALSRLPEKQFIGVYLDLWPTDDENGFSAAYAKALAEAFNSKLDDMIDWARRSVPSLSPHVTINDKGHAELSISVAGSRTNRSTLKSLLEAPNAESLKKKIPIVVVFDEFQQLLFYPNDSVLRQLRSSIQEHRNVSYIFLGSRKHLIQSMIQDKKQPLYGSGAHYLLGPIATEHWLSFVKEKFSKTGKIIEDEVIRDICDQTEGHPFYTQHLCHLVWELTPDQGVAERNTLSQAIDILLQRQQYLYEAIWDSLTSKQKKLLEGIALEPEARIYSMDFINRYELGRASTAQAALGKLLERDILDHDRDFYLVTDRFLRLWIRRTFGDGTPV
jgi:uncharacterized protein